MIINICIYHSIILYHLVIFISITNCSISTIVVVPKLTLLELSLVYIELASIHDHQILRTSLYRGLRILIAATFLWWLSLYYDIKECIEVESITLQREILINVIRICLEICHYLIARFYSSQIPPVLRWNLIIHFHNLPYLPLLLLLSLFQSWPVLIRQLLDRLRCSLLLDRVFDINFLVLDRWH